MELARGVPEGEDGLAFFFFFFALPVSGKRKADGPHVVTLALQACLQCCAFAPALPLCGGVGAPPKRRPELAEAPRPLRKDGVDATSPVQIRSPCFSGFA